MKSKLILSTILLVTIHYISGCKDDEQPPIVNITGSEILIANEGNFGWGEGTLSIYNETTKMVQNDVYKAKNGESMGNVFNSIASFDGQYFFVINNSGKVLITDSNFVKTGEITGLTSPRNLYKVSDNKAYITDLYADALMILNLKTNTVSGIIPCNGHSEEGVVLEGKFWFTAPETSKIYGVDITSNVITDSITVGWMPESIVLDNDKRMWILNRGDVSKNADAMLTMLRINGNEITAIKTVLNGVPTNLVFDPQLNSLYFLNNGVRRLDISNSTEPKLWLAEDNHVFYALKINPKNSEVYVSDVKDFVSKSTIKRYSYDGVLLDEFTAGIIAGDFFFP